VIPNVKEDLLICFYGSAIFGVRGGKVRVSVFFKRRAVPLGKYENDIVATINVYQAGFN
jgi:hypothetical protein